MTYLLSLAKGDRDRRATTAVVEELLDLESCVLKSKLEDHRNTAWIDQVSKLIY